MNQKVFIKFSFLLFPPNNAFKVERALLFHFSPLAALMRTFAGLFQKGACESFNVSCVQFTFLKTDQCLNISKLLFK